MEPTFRPFEVRDREACLALFDGNTPPFFDPSERPSFSAFLERIPCPFFVLEAEGAVVACGGYFLEQSGEAMLAWGMVRRDLHGRGLGTLLLDARIRHMRSHCAARQLVLDTSQHSEGFFRRRGFVTVRTAEDHYGPGLHRIDMVLAL